ncbi:MAG: cytochrome P450 [Steroidobacteraceae bacterium]
MANDKPFDVASYMPRFDVRSAEFTAHHNEIISYLPTNCPVFKATSHFGLQPEPATMIASYEGIMQTARDYRIMSSAPTEQELALAKARLAPLTLPSFSDPPTQLDYRRIIQPFVSPKAAMAMRAEVHDLVTKLIDRFIERGSMDLVQDIAQPLSAIVTMRVTGLPIEKWHYYSDPVHRLLWRDGDQVALRTELAALLQELRAEISRQRNSPEATGVMATLKDKQVDGRPIEEWEVEGMIWLMILGGVDTTQALLGSAFVHLGRSALHRQQLIDDPAIIPDAIEEYLRFNAPVLFTRRRTMVDTQVEGHQLRAGETTLMCWAAANRDPRAFANPNEVDFNRENKQHLTFSVGPHVCLGAHVARMEMRVVVEEVFKRLPDFKLDEPNLVFAPDVGLIYGYKAVPVSFTPGAKSGSDLTEVNRLVEPYRSAK